MQSLSIKKRKSTGEPPELVKTFSGRKSIDVAARSSRDLKPTTSSFNKYLSFKGSFRGGTGSDVIDNVKEVENEVAPLERFRLQTKAFLAYSTLGRLYDTILLVMSVISCFAFIYQTYLPINSSYSMYGTETGAALQNSRLNRLELVVASIFTVDFMLSLFIADHKVEFLRRYDT